jgi:CelD/BcsL family acetyltransferase involved in cellulose biosynthesis
MICLPQIMAKAVSHVETRVLRLTTLAEMAGVEALWRDLDAKTKAPLVWFQSFEWCFNWMKFHTGFQPLVLMLVEQDQAVAVLPLMHKRNRVGVRALRPLGEPHTQYANVLTANGNLTETQNHLLREALFAEADIDQLLFTLVPEASALASLLPRDGRLETLDNRATHLDLQRFADVKDYEKSLGKKTARNMRSATTKLEAMGTLTFEVLCPEDESYAASVETCLRMKDMWLGATGRISQGLEQSGHADFLKAMAGQSPMAFVLKLDGKPIAVELGYMQSGHYYAYMGAFDWSLRNLSPGKLQMHKSICWLITEGVRTLDLLAHPSAYKEHYASHGTALNGYAVNRTWRGYVYTAIWTRRAKPMLKQLFSALPGNWRSSVYVMRKLEYNFVA